jgi:hypothetical protein
MYSAPATGRLKEERRINKTKRRMRKRSRSVDALSVASWGPLEICVTVVRIWE